MPYRINHIHLKAPDPRKTAEWYVRAFNFKILSDETRVFGDRFVRCLSEDGGMAFIAFPRLLAYGDGGFRFTDGRHEGSVTVINGVIGAWRAAALSDVAPADFEAMLAADPRPDFVLLGTGKRIAPAPAEVRGWLREQGLGLEVMDTPAACRVYATLVSESRRFAAALIAV